MVRKWPEIITTCTSIFVISYFKTVQRSSSRVVLVMKRWCGAEVFGDFRSFIIGLETYSLQRAYRQCNAIIDGIVVVVR